MAESSREEIAKLEALYANNPGGRVFTHLAEAYRKAGELDRARKILEDGISRHTDYASAQVVLGRVLLDLGESDDATVAFRRVLELDPENRVAVRALGDLAHTNGREAEALTHYRQLLTLDPTDEQLRRRVDELMSAPPSAQPSAEVLSDETEPVPAEASLVAEADPVTESDPVAEPDPIAESDPVFESASVAEQDPVTEPDPVESDQPQEPADPTAPEFEGEYHEPLAIESAADTVSPPIEQTVTSDFSLGWDTAEDEQSDELPGDLARLMDGLEDRVGFDTPLSAEDPDGPAATEFDAGMAIDLGPRDEPPIENAGDFEVDLTSAEPESETDSLSGPGVPEEFGEEIEKSDAGSSEAPSEADPWEAPNDADPGVPTGEAEPWETSAEAEPWETPAESEPWETPAESEPWAPSSGAEPWEPSVESDRWTPTSAAEPSDAPAESDPWTPTSDAEPSETPAEFDSWTAATDDEPWTSAPETRESAAGTEPGAEDVDQEISEPESDDSRSASIGDAGAEEPDVVTAESLQDSEPAAFPEGVSAADDFAPGDSVEEAAEVLSGMSSDQIGGTVAALDDTDATPSVFEQPGGDESDWIVGDDAIMDVVRRAEPADPWSGELQPEPSAQEPSFEALLSSSRGPSYDDDEPQPTETLAELYRAQGFDDQAATVYRALLAQRPGDVRLEQKLAELEERDTIAPEAEFGLDDEPVDALESAWIDAGGQDLAEPSPFSWTEDAIAEAGSGPSIGDYFTGLLAWSPANGAGPVSDGSVPVTPALDEPMAEPQVALSETPAVAELVDTGAADSAESGAAAPVVEPEPWEQPVAPPLQMTPPEEPAAIAPSPSLVTTGNPVEAAFDEWFTGGPSAAAPTPTSEPLGGEVASNTGNTTSTEQEAAASAPVKSPVLDDGDDESDDDLEMFRSWLQSLKR